MAEGKPDDESNEGWALKRRNQGQWRELAASGQLPPDAGFLITREQAQAAKVKWPEPEIPLTNADQIESGET